MSFVPVYGTLIQPRIIVIAQIIINNVADTNSLSSFGQTLPLVSHPSRASQAESRPLRSGLGYFPIDS